MTVPPQVINWIFVLAPTHRCGSTLLQRLLNSDPGVHIWGETCIGPALLQMARALDRMDERGGASREAFLRGDRDTWTACMVPPPEVRAQAFWTLLYRLLVVGDKRPGSKEIGYDRDVFELMAGLLPNARFLLLVRNPLDAYRSLKNQSWWHGDTEHFARAWARKSSEYAAIAAESERARLVRYEDLDLAECRRIFEFLELAASETVLEPILDRRLGTSAAKQGLTDDETETILAGCADAYAVVYDAELVTAMP